MRDKVKLLKCFSLGNNRYLVIVIICLLMFSCAYGSKTNALNYGVEFLGASAGDILIGIPSGLFISGMIFGGSFNLVDMGPGLTFAGSAYVIGGSIGAPLGTILSGKIIHTDGSVLGAYAGGFVGMGLGILALASAEKISGQVAWPSFLLLPPTCSVIGYNLFPHKTNSQSMLFNKNLPSLGLTILPEKYGDKISPKIGANITVRF